MSWLDANQVVAIFNQDRIWVDRHRTTHNIGEMSTEYLENLTGWLIRHYPYLRASVVSVYGFIEQPMALLAEMRQDPDEVQSERESILPLHVHDTKLFKAIQAERRRRENVADILGKEFR